MHALYLTQYYTTDDQAGGIKHYRHVQNLLRRGHRVTVVTSYVTHTERTIPDEYRGRSIVAETEGSLTVYKTYAYPGYGNSFRSRGWNYLTFMHYAFLAGLRVKDVDLVLTYSPPLPLGMVGWCLAKLKRAKYVFEAGDVWPDVLVALGVVRTRGLTWILRFLEILIYRVADKVVLYSPRARMDVQRKGIPPAKLHTATLGIDLQSGPATFDGDDRTAHGITNSLHFILEAAIALREYDDIRFVFIGDGEQRPSLMQQAHREGLVNVVFKPPVTKSEIFRELSTANVGLWVRHPHPYFEYMLPNKIFDYLEASIPVVAAGSGDTADLVQAAQCGLVTPVADTSALAEAVLWMRGHPDEACQMGRRGRQYVRKYYDREHILTEYSRVLEELVRD
jgi:glycosyltransferase involved in cell wall biosynthesis